MSAPRSSQPLSMRAEHGFTLIELLVSMLVATVITGAAMSFLIFTTEDVSHITARVGVDQEGRVEMQRLISELNSACDAPNAAPILTGTSASALIFESAAGEGAELPAIEKHEVIFTKATGTTEGTLVENDYVSTKPTEVEGRLRVAFSSTPTAKRRLLTGIEPTQYGSEKATPIFRYYRYYYEGASPPQGQSTPPYGEIDPNPLENPSAEAANIAKVTIAFTLAPRGKEVVSFNHDRPVALEDSALFRLAPSSETPTVKNAPCEKP